MAELRIVFDDTDPHYIRVFVGQEQIGLIQQIRVLAEAHAPRDYQLEVVFPPDDVIMYLDDETRAQHARQRALLKPFLNLRDPRPPRPICPTVWEHINRDDE